MLSYQIERLRRVKNADAIVVATTTNASDNPIVAFCEAEQVTCTRGSETDVLSRYAEAAGYVGADTVVRVTSDCPLIDPELIDAAIEAFRDRAAPCDYVSNMIEPSWPYGMAVEVFSASALKQANEQAQNAAEREHVTPYIYWRPQSFRLKSLKRAPDLSSERWTVDTPEDFELVGRILDALYKDVPHFKMDDVLAVLAANPSWRLINQHVAQKHVSPTVGEA